MSARRVSDGEYREITEFLYREAEALDAGRLAGWLELVTKDVRYRVVAPSVRHLEDKNRGKNSEVLLLDETFETLGIRVKQQSTPKYTIAENPRSFMRRFVTNVLASHGGEEDTFDVDSNLLLYRGRGSELAPHVFSARRQDVLKRVNGQLMLHVRAVTLDESTIETRNIGGFF